MSHIDQNTFAANSSTAKSEISGNIVPNSDTTSQPDPGEKLKSEGVTNAEDTKVGAGTRSERASAPSTTSSQILKQSSNCSEKETTVDLRKKMFVFDHLANKLRSRGLGLRHGDDDTRGSGEGLI